MHNESKKGRLPDQELDATFGEALRALPEDDRQEESLDELYLATKKICDTDDSRIGTRLRDAPTRYRALLIAGVVSIMAIVAIVALPETVKATVNVQWVLAAATYGVLVLLTAYCLLRPVYRPAPSGKLILLLVGIGGTSAFFFAWMLSGSATFDGSWRAVSSAMPCVGMGLLMGVPVFGLLRLLDRGHPLGALLAAIASGLLANLLLQLHCPTLHSEHLVFGHASVLVFFVVGVVLVQWITHRKKRV